MSIMWDEETLKALLRDTPEDHVIERLGWEARLQELRITRAADGMAQEELTEPEELAIGANAEENYTIKCGLMVAARTIGIFLAIFFLFLLLV